MDHHTFLGNCLPYPSPKLTLTITPHLGQNVGLGEGNQVYVVNAKRYKRQARTFTQPCQCSGTETRVALVCKHQVLRKCGAFLVWSFVLIYRSFKSHCSEAKTTFSVRGMFWSFPNSLLSCLSLCSLCLPLQAEVTFSRSKLAFAKWLHFITFFT